MHGYINDVSATSGAVAQFTPYRLNPVVGEGTVWPTEEAHRKSDTWSVKVRSLKES